MIFSVHLKNLSPSQYPIGCGCPRTSKKSKTRHTTRYRALAVNARSGTCLDSGQAVIHKFTESLCLCYPLPPLVHHARHSAETGITVKAKPFRAASPALTVPPWFRLFGVAADGRERLRRGFRTRTQQRKAKRHLPTAQSPCRHTTNQSGSGYPSVSSSSVSAWAWTFFPSLTFRLPMRAGDASAVYHRQLFCRPSQMPKA